MSSSLIGVRGERSVDNQLCRPLADGGNLLFDVRFLGEKAMLLDFFVRLLDEEENLTGAYFFLQIKSARSPAKFVPALSPTRILIEFTAAEVTLAQRMDAPVYIVAVDVRSFIDETAYICGVDSDRRAGLYGVPMVHNLMDGAVKRQLHTEVTEFFLSRIPVNRKSVFSSTEKLDSDEEGDDE